MGRSCIAAGILVSDHLCTPIDRFPAAGELILAQDLPLCIGGCAANVAMDLAKLESPADVIGCVGKDPFGEHILQTLQSHGINTSAIRALDNVPTSQTLIINVRGEDRRFIHCQGASKAFRVDMLDETALRSASVFYLGGYLLMPGLDPHALADRLKTARRAGAKVLLDVVLPGPGDHLSTLAPVLAECDYFLPNDDEAAAITGKSNEHEQADCFLAMGAAHVVITGGEKGALFASPGERLRAAPYEMTYVGGTGAGDAFVAGFIAALLENRGNEECLAWASAVGASCVRSISATDGVFTRPELNAFLASHPMRLERV